jgi:hypothetical protein
MDRTDASLPSPPLIALGDQDAAVCADGVCKVPASQAPAAEAAEPQP